MTAEATDPPRILIDTNVLVYGFDHSEPEKQAMAIALLRRLAATGEAAISTQVIGEFHVTVTRKLADPLSPTEAAAVVADQIDAWTVLGTDDRISLEAARGCERYGLHFWDAQLWATALANRIPVILTEDFEDGREIEGVTTIDPFAAGFELAPVLP